MTNQRKKKKYGKEEVKEMYRDNERDKCKMLYV